MTLRTALAIAGLILSTALAAAQGFRDRDDPRRGGKPGDFDFYVLSLSWSPTFCDSEAGRRNRSQCGIHERAEFVVHGLWPQYTRGFPSYCGVANRSIPRNALDKAATVYPDERLARYQWEKHGTCSGQGPGEYFADVAQARAKVVIPAEFARPARNLHLTGQEIERAFTTANKGLRADMIGLQCAQNMLKEVRICLSKDVRGFVPCPEVGRSSCRARDIVIPSAR